VDGEGFVPHHFSLCQQTHPLKDRVLYDKIRANIIKTYHNIMNLSITVLELLDYAVFFAALLAVLVIGLRFGGKIDGLEDYATSRGKRFSAPVLAMTLIVTMVGSNASIGSINEIYKDGIIYFIHSIMCSFGIFLLIQYAAKFMTRRYNKAISIYGILEQEYGTWQAKFSSSVSVFISVVALSMQMIGMGYVAKIFLGLPFYVGLLGTSVIFILYSSFGGIRGVVYTDVLQFFIILVVFPILVGIIVYNIGGLNLLFEKLPTAKLEVLSHPNLKEYSFLTLFWIMPFGFLYPDLVQRFLMCRDGKDLQRIGLSWVLFRALFLSMVAIIGLASIVLLPSSVAGKEVVPSLMKDYLPAGFKGIAITGFLAVIMSSADSLLNSATVLIAEIHISQKNRAEKNKKDPSKKDKNKETLSLKLSSMCLGFIALGLALLDFSFIKSITIASAISFAAVNIPIFFAPFKDKNKRAINAYLGSTIGGFSAFLILWLSIGHEKMYMVSFFAMFFAIAGWFIGANFFDRIKTTFWRQILDNYAPKFNLRELLDASRSYGYFVVFGILTFLLRYALEAWDFFAPEYTIVSALLTVCCALLVILYFGDKIRVRSEPLFIFIWLLTIFLSLPLYNMVALLQNAESMINLAGLIIAVLVMNVMLNWRMSIMLFMLAFAITSYLNHLFFHKTDLLNNFEYLSIMVYVTVAGVIMTMILRKVRENTALEKLEYSDAMACSIAHELKSPISTINMMLNVYNSKDKEGIKKLLEEIRNAQNSSNEILSRTIQLFAQNDGTNLKDEDLNLTDLTIELIKGRVKGLPQKYHNCISFDIKPNFMVHAYKNNLLTIIDNLFNNAYKYALSQKKNATLCIYSKGNTLVFHDTGPGMSSDKILSVFDKGVTYDKRGSGFGLYYCKLEMQRIRGDITCESKEGEYTKFTLTFPVPSKEAK
jgi:Na+/proline symporter/signal transduction histidine kinase